MKDKKSCVCETAIYVMYFLYLLVPFTDKWEIFIFLMKKDLIIDAKMFKGSLGIVSSPNSSAVCGCFILQHVQVLAHLAVSLSPSRGSWKGLWLKKG